MRATMSNTSTPSRHEVERQPGARAVYAADAVREARAILAETEPAGTLPVCVECYSTHPEPHGHSCVAAFALAEALETFIAAPVSVFEADPWNVSLTTKERGEG